MAVSGKWIRTKAKLTTVNYLNFCGYSLCDNVADFRFLTGQQLAPAKSRAKAKTRLPILEAPYKGPSSRNLEARPISLNLSPDGALRNVIVDDSNRLHERVNCRWTNKLPAKFLQFF